jgi:hypothetical protein
VGTVTVWLTGPTSFRSSIRKFDRGVASEAMVCPLMVKVIVVASPAPRRVTFDRGRIGADVRNPPAGSCTIPPPAAAAASI